MYYQDISLLLLFIDILLMKQVLNAGKNKLRAMSEIESITSLRALILNGIISY